MNFLYDKNSHFNLANLSTMANIVSGVLAIFFITHGNFFLAALFAWIGGAFDIFDGKLARKYSLSTEFGVQLDSYADFLSFVIVPVMFIYFAIMDPVMGGFFSIIVMVCMVYYVISGLRRLIEFNIKADAGSVEKYFTGMPTPLGAILLWVLYLSWYADIISSEYIILTITVAIGYLLNSKAKIPHP